ncbi:major strawberry allergen Fra a 1.06-like [Mercurialis annua]|uniref:major strawberry allergen Fra a 1.06-like n=1 Tax=Mercurialis annua TaxID=3986 RepID=UPI00215FE8E1|nr:major strawberry allergen Fra a 1.06-like [Mercurialis annua]
MGVLSYEAEFSSSIPPANLFKAMVLDMVTLLPKIFPQLFTNFVTLQGDGGPGTIRQVNLADGRTLKERTEAVDKENFRYVYSIIEGDVLTNNIEKICNEVSLTVALDGGTICKRSSRYFTADDVDVKEEEIKAHNEKTDGILGAILKAFEHYLLENPLN